MKFSQFGTATIVILLLVVANIYSVEEFKMTFTFPPNWIGIVSFLPLLIGILFFYKLTIYVDNQSVAFKFGIGWFGKTYKISDIESCIAVKNPFWYGFGFLKTSKFWLYNVSGLGAIELTFKNQKGIVRIGTDKPEEVANFINQKLELTYKESGN